MIPGSSFVMGVTPGCTKGILMALYQFTPGAFRGHNEVLGIKAGIATSKARALPAVLSL